MPPPTSQGKARASSSDRQSQPKSMLYEAAKTCLLGLLLAVALSRMVRVLHRARLQIAYSITLGRTADSYLVLGAGNLSMGQGSHLFARQPLPLLSSRSH